MNVRPERQVGIDDKALFAIRSVQPLERIAQAGWDVPD
jgi:hypothetical protein